MFISKIIWSEDMIQTNDNQKRIRNEKNIRIMRLFQETDATDVWRRSWEKNNATSFVWSQADQVDIELCEQVSVNATRINYDEEALMTCYCQRLKNRVKNTMMLTNRFKDLHTMIDKSIEIDNTQYERKLEKKEEKHIFL
jgi:hypothetical protein